MAKKHDFIAFPSLPTVTVVHGGNEVQFIPCNFPLPTGYRPDYDLGEDDDGSVEGTLTTYNLSRAFMLSNPVLDGQTPDQQGKFSLPREDWGSVIKVDGSAFPLPADPAEAKLKTNQLQATQRRKLQELRSQVAEGKERWTAWKVAEEKAAKRAKEVTKPSGSPVTPVTPVTSEKRIGPPRDYDFRAHPALPVVTIIGPSCQMNFLLDLPVPRGFSGEQTHIEGNITGYNLACIFNLARATLSLATKDGTVLAPDCNGCYAVGYEYADKELTVSGSQPTIPDDPMKAKVKAGQQEAARNRKLKEMGTQLAEAKERWASWCQELRPKEAAPEEATPTAHPVPSTPQRMRQAEIASLLRNPPPTVAEEPMPSAPAPACGADAVPVPVPPPSSATPVPPPSSATPVPPVVEAAPRAPTEVKKSSSVQPEATKVASQRAAQAKPETTKKAVVSEKEKEKENAVPENAGKVGVEAPNRAETATRAVKKELRKEPEHKEHRERKEGMSQSTSRTAAHHKVQKTQTRPVVYTKATAERPEAKASSGTAAAKPRHTTNPVDPVRKPLKPANYTSHVEPAAAPSHRKPSTESIGARRAAADAANMRLDGVGGISEPVSLLPANELAYLQRPSSSDSGLGDGNAYQRHVRRQEKADRVLAERLARREVETVTSSDAELARLASRTDRTRMTQSDAALASAVHRAPGGAPRRPRPAMTDEELARKIAQEEYGGRPSAYGRSRHHLSDEELARRIAMGEFD